MPAAQRFSPPCVLMPRFGGSAHHLLRAAAEVDRFEYVEVERALDASSRVPRRQLEIDDDRVAVALVELAEGFPDDFFVLAHDRK